MIEQEWWFTYSKVIVSSDRLLASLYMADELDPNVSLTVSGCEDWLSHHQVVYGFCHSQIEQIVVAPATFQGQTVSVAMGTPARPGIDAQLQIYIADDGPSRPTVLEDGRVDFFHVTRIRNVNIGTLLAQKIPAEPGVDGIDVFGMPLKAPTSRDIRLPHGKNVLLSNDGLSAYAGIDGHVVYLPRDHQLHVYSTFTVPKDVDFSVGNIDVVGNVLIQGNVHDGFQIKAEGDIEIHGYVGAAEIIAGGNITIHGGIQARGKGRIEAGGTVHSKFIQNSKVSAGFDCIVQDSIMHSEVNANHQIHVVGRKAVIVGGIVRAGDSVVTKNLGSTMSTPTEIEVGVRPELRDELIQIDQKLKELEVTKDKSRKAADLLEHLLKQGKVLPPDKMILRQNLQNTLMSIDHEIGNLYQHRQNVENEFSQTKLARVAVEEYIYSGVRISISHLTHYVREQKHHLVYLIEAGDIYCKPM